MKNIKAPRMVTIAILSLITVVFWVGFEVFRIFTRRPEEPVPPEIILALDPTLDQTALSKLQGRVYIEDSTISLPSIAPSATVAPIPEPTVAPSPEAVATTSATPTATASASPGGSAQ